MNLTIGDTPPMGDWPTAKHLLTQYNRTRK
jgi:hypothetical protein